MDEKFYRAYDEAHGTHFADASVYSDKEAGETFPKNVLTGIRQLEDVMNATQYGEPWTISPKRIVRDRQGKEAYICVLEDARSGGKFEVRLPADHLCQGVHDWIESMYRQLRRLFHGLRDWEQEETKRKVEAFEQLPEDIKKEIARKYTQNDL